MLRGLIGRVRFFFDHRWSPRHASAYLDGDLATASRERIERHVHDCYRCRELLTSLRATIAALRGIGTKRGDDPQASVASEVLAGFRERAGERGDDGQLD